MVLETLRPVSAVPPVAQALRPTHVARRRLEATARQAGYLWLHRLLPGTAH